MGSSAQQGFVDPYSYEAGAVQQNNTLGSYGLAPGGLVSRIAQWLGFGTEENYENQKLADDRAYERASIDSARAWSEYMDNTQVQRRVKDIEAAGLNPWLAVQNGLSGTGSPSVDTGGSAQHTTKSNQSKTGLVMLLLGLAKMIK